MEYLMYYLFTANGAASRDEAIKYNRSEGNVK